MQSIQNVNRKCSSLPNDTSFTLILSFFPPAIRLDIGPYPRRCRTVFMLRRLSALQTYWSRSAAKKQQKNKLNSSLSLLREAGSRLLTGGTASRCTRPRREPITLLSCQRTSWLQRAGSPLVGGTSCPCWPAWPQWWSGPPTAQSPALCTGNGDSCSVPNHMLQHLHWKSKTCFRNI